MPSPLLTNALAPQFDAYVRKKTEDVKPVTDEDLQSLLVQLPTAHWFLLADVGAYKAYPDMCQCKAD